MYKCSLLPVLSSAGCWLYYHEFNVFPLSYCTSKNPSYKIGFLTNYEICVVPKSVLCIVERATAAMAASGLHTRLYRGMYCTGILTGVPYPRVRK